MSSSPKFELHGISYYRADPDRSMAMICEPGGTRRWVREGDQVGHIVVERIESDCLVYRDGVRSQTMALASSEAIAGFARRANDRPQPPEPSVVTSRNTPAPPPVRGLRQMPLARVAAKLGLPSREKALPDQGDVETQ